MAAAYNPNDPNNDGSGADAGGNGGYLSTDPNYGMTPGQAGAEPGGITGYGAPGMPTPTMQDTTAPGGTIPTSAAAPSITNPNDPNQVRAWLQWRASQPGADPILGTPGGIDYYTNAILQNGGLTDTNYWTNKSTLAQYGGAVGAGGGAGGGIGGYGSLWNTLPTEAQAENMPGFQFALNKGVNAILNNKAALGLNQSGAAMKDILDYATGDALQGYGQLAGLNLNYNQANTGNLLGLAGLGLQGISTGAA